jgi:hypothetical protein
MAGVEVDSASVESVKEIRIEQIWQVVGMNGVQGSALRPF